jgi:NAD(P)-dependent dehydrogenase (short-subunit alcohol dehydrogenase family)
MMPERIPVVRPRSAGQAYPLDVTSDRVVLITGATGALGRVVAGAFATDGCRIGLGGTDPGRLVEVAREAGLPDDRWVAAVGDLRTEGGATAAATAVAERFGRIDVLLHLVGGFVPGAPIAELDPENLRFMLDRHLWTTLFITRAVVPGMVERGWGRVIAVTSSITATTPARTAIYATTKSAQETLLRVLAKETAGSGVTVNVVAAKAVDADHQREREPSPKNAGWVTPEELADTFRFLVSDEAAAITGARIPLDART